MKGLLLAVGLIAALFVSNSNAGIYDLAHGVLPKINSHETWQCFEIRLSFDDCVSLSKSKMQLESSDSSIVQFKGTVSLDGNNNFEVRYNVWNVVPSLPAGGYYQFTQDKVYNMISRREISDSRICPPDSNPTHIFSYYATGQSVVSKCYDPRELDNLSKCSDLFNSGSILSAGANTSSLVCKTFDDGSRCAFSRVEQGSTPYYQPNLEKGCFGDAEQIPDYDNDNPPSPQPEQCTPYFGGFACAADPKNYCSSTGVCVDGCGYVNGQFICFRDEECKGASCEPAPVNCETVPDAPICKDKETIPEPTFCEKNPTVESCQSGSDFCKKNPLSPSCQLGGDGTGSGGSKFVLDYDKLIQGMKDAAKTLIDSNPIPDNTAMDKSLDDENKAIKSDYDNFLNDGVFSEIRNTSQRPIFSSLETLFPTGSGTCSFNFGKFSIEICSTAEKLREILYWVFSILTLIYLRHLFYQTIRTSAGK